MTEWDDRLPGVPAQDIGPSPLDPVLVSELADLLHHDRVTEDTEVGPPRDDVAPMLLLLLDE